jgi:hypothetical protein
MIIYLIMRLFPVLFYFLHHIYIVHTLEQFEEEQKFIYKTELDEKNQQEAILKEKEELKEFLSHCMEVIIQNLIFKEKKSNVHLTQLFKEIHSKILYYNIISDNILFYCSSSFSKKPIIITFPVENDIIRNKIVYILNYSCRLCSLTPMKNYLFDFIKSIITFLPFILQIIYYQKILKDMNNSKNNSQDIPKWTSANNLNMESNLSLTNLFNTYSEDQNYAITNAVNKWKYNYLAYTRDMKIEDNHIPLLCYGPAGSGKTEIGYLIFRLFKKMQKKNKLKKEIIYLKACGSDFATKEFIGTGCKVLGHFINLIKENIKKNKIVCIQIDEADSLITQRITNLSSNGNDNETKNFFLYFLDEIAKCPNCFLFLTTNIPCSKQDSSTTRRMQVIEIKCDFNVEKIKNIFENIIINLTKQYPEYTKFISKLIQKEKINEYSNIIYNIYKKKYEAHILTCQLKYSEIQESLSENISINSKIDLIHKYDYSIFLSPIKIMEILVSRLLALQQINNNNNINNNNIENIDIKNILNINKTRKEFFNQHQITEQEETNFHTKLLEDYKNPSKY